MKYDFECEFAATALSRVKRGAAQTGAKLRGLIGRLYADRSGNYLMITAIISPRWAR